MTGLRMIASAAYIEQELAAEFGKIPPAFLPIGVQRLYEAQLALLGPGPPIHLTVPENFSPAPYDQRRLAALNVVLVPVPEGLRLGESIVYALNFISAPAGPLQLLHGDTLIGSIPDGAIDGLAIHAEGDDYSWAAVDLADDGIKRLEVIAAGTGYDDTRPVACGYFAFGDTSLLVRCLTRARGDFIAGLNLYTAERRLRALDVPVWRDFGHIQTYFRSRCAITTARSFNTLAIDATTVRKSSDDRDKMAAEAAWFQNLPAAAQPYTARLLETGEAEGVAFYRTEYQYAPTLAELFVFASIGRPTWRNILRSCQDFLSLCAAQRGPGKGDECLGELVVSKTMERLERFQAETGFGITQPTRLDGKPMPSLVQIAERISALINLHSGRPETLMHGDFCFSNILYNSRAGRISVIDPRGYVQAGQNSMFGDTRYDLAKLAHSVIGHYDHIMAGRYAVRRDGRHGFAISFETSAADAWLQGALAEIEVDGVRAGSAEIRAITTGLFLSMLPLHADRPDRQDAFIANALRLYAALDDVTA
jgi:hypothetical protein